MTTTCPIYQFQFLFRLAKGDDADPYAVKASLISQAGFRLDFSTENAAKCLVMAQRPPQMLLTNCGPFPRQTHWLPRNHTQTPPQPPGNFNWNFIWWGRETESDDLVTPVFYISPSDNARMWI